MGNSGDEYSLNTAEYCWPIARHTGIRKLLDLRLSNLIICPWGPGLLRQQKKAREKGGDQTENEVSFLEYMDMLHTLNFSAVLSNFFSFLQRHSLSLCATH